MQLISHIGNDTEDDDTITDPHNGDGSLNKGSWSRAFQATRRTCEEGGTTHNPSHDDANPLGVSGTDSCRADAQRYDVGSSARRGGAGCAGREGGGCCGFWCGTLCRFGARRCRAGCAGVLRVFD